jgi:putative ABC transport system permease protein
MGIFVADLRYAFRMLWKNPGFSGVAIAALVLGIGANIAIFTVIDAVLLRPLPYAESDRMAIVARKFPGDNVGDSASIPKYMIWRQNDVFESMTLHGFSAPGMNLGSKDHPDQVKGTQVSAGYFRVFGAAPTIGRTFTEQEDLPGGPPVVVVSYNIWQSRLGGDPAIVGRTLTLNNAPYTVIGVLPKGFQPDPPSDLFLPLQADPASTNQGHYLRVIGRLKPGVTLAAAQAEMKVLGDRFRRENPKWMDKNESVAVVPLAEFETRNVKPALFVLAGAVGFVLLIACANVANLLLARAAVRAREMAVRAAVGAGRWRVVRQLLTESVVLAGIGGVLGFILGSWGVRALLLLTPGNIPRLTDPDGIVSTPPLDWRIAVFSLGLALLTGILFGLLPALRISNPDLASTLKESSGRAGSGRHNRLRSVLVVSEIALALVLLVGAALMIRTFIGLNAVRPGLDPHNVLTLQTSMASGTYSTTEAVAGLVTQVTRRLEGVPGVEAAASSIVLPMENGVDLPFNIAGKTPPNGEQYAGDEMYRSISPHYFRVFRIPLLRGRAFTENDTPNSPRVVVINQALAKKYWPKEDPIGQVMIIGKGLGPQFDDPPREIVGIVGSVAETGLKGGIVPVMYIPQSQVPQGLTTLANQVLPLTWCVRTAMDPSTLTSAITAEFRNYDAGLVPSEVRGMEQVIAKSVSRQNFNMLLLGIFAAIALLLAAIGIYGLIAYSVQQRTQEIGIRLALGAARGHLLRMVLRQGLTLAGIGVVMGLAIAYGLTRLIASLLYGVKASDPWTFGGVALLLSLVALIATYIPARRAAATEPVEALRYQ